MASWYLFKKLEVIFMIVTAGYNSKTDDPVSIALCTGKNKLFYTAL